MQHPKNNELDNDEPEEASLSASPPGSMFSVGIGSEIRESGSMTPLPRHFYVPMFVRHPPIEAAVLVWGVNEDYQLGLENPADQSRPKVLDSMLGIRLSGRSFLSRPIVAGSRHSLAIDAYGQVYTWGWNARGTLGHGHREIETKPKKILSLASSRVRIVQAAIGGWHCLAVSDQGQVYAWGGNEYEQCAMDSDVRDVIRPQAVLPSMRVRQVSAGGMHSVALTYEGEVWTWGEPWGEFALNLTRKPRKIEGLERVIKTACGAFHNLALTAEGRVYSWGTNDYGQLGSGDTSYSNVARAVVGLEDQTLIDIACGGWHSACITDKGEVFVWGRGEYGRLGLGDRSGSTKLRPMRVEGLLGHVIVEVSCGGTHTLCLTQEGRVFVFGRADYGRLGLGDAANKDVYTPMEIPMPGGNTFWKVISVSAGGRHSVVLALPDRSDEETDRRSSRNTGGPASIGEMVPLEDLAALSMQEPSLMLMSQVSPPITLNGGSVAGSVRGPPTHYTDDGAAGTLRGMSSERGGPYSPRNLDLDLGGAHDPNEDEDEEGDWLGPGPIGAHRTALDDMIDDIAGVDPTPAQEDQGGGEHPGSGGIINRMATSGENNRVTEPEVSPIRPPKAPQPAEVAASRTHPRTSPGIGGGGAVPVVGTSVLPGNGVRASPNHPPPARRISAIQLALERSGELDGHEEVDDDVCEF